MKYTPTNVAGVTIVDIEPDHDHRGFVSHSFSADEFADHGLIPDVTHTNIWFNYVRGTVRGLYRQAAPHAEAKLIRCTRGAIAAVAVDVRPQSPTYAQHVMVELSADNRRALFVPPYIAHGFQALADNTEVSCQTSGQHVPNAQDGFRWNEPEFGIEWPLPVTVISEQDASWPLLSAQATPVSSTPARQPDQSAQPAAVRAPATATATLPRVTRPTACASSIRYKSTATHDRSSTVTVRMAVSGSIVERCDTDEVLSLIASRLRCTSSPSLAVGSVNLDHLHHFRKIRTAPNGQLEWFWVADGMPIAWRGQLLTAAPWPRVTGADLLPSILTLAEATGQRVGFIGGRSKTQHMLAEYLQQRYPALAVSGMWAPEPREIESCSAALAAAIRTARTDILIVSLGKPRQELWVDRYGCATGARILLPCGGAINFLAGTTRRAPVWMQHAGLEWLYRLAQEPRRLARRYLVHGPVSLLRASRAQLICYPGVYDTGTSVNAHPETSTAPREPATALAKKEPA